MASRKFVYETCCVNSTAEAIHDMIERSRSVAYSTVKRKCDITDFESQFTGVKIKDDWHVRYAKSVYLGKPCY